MNVDAGAVWLTIAQTVADRQRRHRADAGDALKAHFDIYQESQ